MNASTHIFLCRDDIHGGPLRLRDEQRRFHLFALGGIGTYARSLVYDTQLHQDILRGASLTILDFDGTLSPTVLDAIPLSRIDDVVYADFGHKKYIPGLNVMPELPRHKRDTYTEHILSILIAFWGEMSIGAASQEVFRSAFRAQLDVPDRLFPGISKMLVNDDYRDHVLSHLTEPFVGDFWHDDYAIWKPEQRSKVIAPLKNKMAALINNPATRLPLCAPDRSINFEEIVSTPGRIFIANLNKRENKKFVARMLGSFVLAQLHAADTTLPTAGRPPHYVYITDIHQYPPDVLLPLLEESRNIRCQFDTTFFGKLDESLRDAILSSVESIAAFNLTPDDAETIAGVFGSLQVSESDLRGRDVDDFHIRLPNDPQPKLVSMLTKTDRETIGIPLYHGHAEKIRTNSFESGRHISTRSRIQRRITRWRQDWADDAA